MTDDVLIGRDLGGFHVLRQLGAGAMGVVYEARERALNRVVALKVLPEAATRDPDRRARFLREARLAASVIHPAVATIHQVGEVDGRVFIAMELVHGVTLRARMSGGDALPLAEVLRIGCALAAGLGRAHAVGVVHRDVKPDNVMLTPDGQVKILDFGIARLSEDAASLQRAASVLTGEGHIIGTPGYMSPEQGRGAQVDARSDVFSLGVVLYELLTGERPFQGATTMEVLIATARDPHPPLSAHARAIPRDIVVIVDRCLAKDATERPASAGEVAEALSACRSALEAAPRAAAVLGMDTLGGAAIEVAPTITGPGAKPSAAPPDAPARRWGALAVIGLVGLAALGVWLASGAGQTSGRAANEAPPGPTAPPVAARDEVLPVAPLASPESILACPIFEVVGAEEPSGWLGAAAAHTTCERAAILLGGESGRTRVPAELLAMPTVVSEDFPVDPFDAPDARARSLVAAREGAAAWIDGEVVVTRDHFALALRLETPVGVVARVRGEGRLLHQAVAQALDALVAARAITPIALSPRVGRWDAAPDTRLALALFDLEIAGSTRLDVDDLIAPLVPERERLRRVWPFVEQLAGARRGFGPIELSEIDESTLEGRAWSILRRSLVASTTERAALADELAALREAAPDPFDRRMLTGFEAEVAYFAGDSERAGRLTLSIATIDPRGCKWPLVVVPSYGQRGYGPAARAGSAWSPDLPDMWNALAIAASDDAVRERMMTRALLVGPDVPVWNLNYAHYLVLRGRSVHARSLGARLSVADAYLRPTSEAIFAIADAAEGKFLAARTRARAALMGLERFGRVEDADVHLAVVMIGMGMILEAGPSDADAFAERFVLASPHRLLPGQFAPLASGDICAHASPAIARACIQRLRELVAEGFFSEGLIVATEAVLDAAERFSQGDFEGAARALRPFIGGELRISFAPLVFDAAGEAEVASRVDVSSLARARMAAGATTAHVREARRAFARKDYARCRELAGQVVTAWGVADTQVPAVKEMRELIARLPP